MSPAQAAAIVAKAQLKRRGDAGGSPHHPKSRDRFPAVATVGSPTRSRMSPAQAAAIVAKAQLGARAPKLISAVGMTQAWL